jgi:hypothetical protein
VECQGALYRRHVLDASPLFGYQVGEAFVGLAEETGSGSERKQG